MLRFLGRALLSLSTLIFFGPFLQGAPAPQASGASPAIKIGYLMDSLKVERWQTDLDAFQKRATELGASVLVETADGDDDLQWRQASKLLDAGVNVLVLVAHDSGKARRIVAAANARHVPILCYDRLVPDSDVDFFVGANSEVIGEMQASWLARLAPEGNYVLIEGSPADTNAKALRVGQMRVLQPLIAAKKIRLVGDSWAKDWNPAEAYAAMSQAIATSGGDITAVVASNDGTAGGAIQALQEHHLAGKVLVSGQDADLAAIIRILDGTQSMTVYKPIAEQARLAAEAAVNLASRVPIRDSVFVPNGAKTMQAVFLTPIVVARTNVMQTVIKDGFQNLATIQKSLPADKWPR